MAKIKSNRLKEVNRKIRGNKIIAYFMKVEYSSDLNYHEDWNKLINVWVKLPTTYDKDNNLVKVDGIRLSILSGDIESAWSRITGFINKYILTDKEYLHFKKMKL